MWRGLTRKPLEDALTTWIESLGIRLLPRHELIDLAEDTNGRITGTVLYDLTENRIVPFAAKHGHRSRWHRRPVRAQPYVG